MPETIMPQTRDLFPVLSHLVARSVGCEFSGQSGINYWSRLILSILSNFPSFYGQIQSFRRIKGLLFIIPPESIYYFRRKKCTPI